MARLAFMQIIILLKRAQPGFQEALNQLQLPTKGKDVPPFGRLPETGFPNYYSSIQQSMTSAPLSRKGGSQKTREGPTGLTPEAWPFRVPIASSLTLRSCG